MTLRWFMSESDSEAIVVACPSCGGTMKLAKVPPKLGDLPELLTFQCLNCNEVMTIEDE